MSDGQVNRDCEDRCERHMHRRKQSLCPAQHTEEFSPLATLVNIGSRAPVSRSLASLERTTQSTGKTRLIKRVFQKCNNFQNIYLSPFGKRLHLKCILGSIFVWKFFIPETPSSLFTFPWRRRSTASHLNQQALRIGQDQARWLRLSIIGKLWGVG